MTATETKRDRWARFDEMLWPTPFKGFLVAVWMQVCDAITTLMFLWCGVREANPIVVSLMHHVTPLEALLLVKAVGMTLALVWYIRGYSFRKLNLGMMALILWNWVAMTLALMGVK